MAKKYFISTSPRTDGCHTVHRHECPFLPEPGKRIFLGDFRSLQDAVMEGRRYFSRPVRCPFCSKEHNEIKRRAFNAGEGKPDLISSSRLKATWESLMLCSLS